jgi:peptide/nickel transport system ATP-binding protein
MYLGEIVEIGDTDEVFTNPQHPYTEALLSSIPEPDPRATREQIELTGTVPDPVNPPSGCRFHTRCHKVVQPDDLDLDQSVWRALITFRYQLRADDIDVEKIRENAGAEDAVREEIRTEFDLPQRISDPEVEETLGRALDRIVDDDVEGAAALLDEEFVTPCEKTHPEYTEHGDGHISACIRHSDQVRDEVPADD